MAVEKLDLTKLGEKPLRWDAIQTTFSIRVDIFYPDISAILAKREFFNSKGPGRWSGESGKELVLAAPFLHPEMERQAMEVGRSGSGGL